MNITIINGPNLNMLGIREPEVYGRETLSDLEAMIRKEAEGLEVTVSFFQSNHEGAIVDHIQTLYGKSDGIIINPAAYTHTSIAVLDALKAVAIPAVEVHLTAIETREAFRRISYISSYAEKTITGQGFHGYLEGLRYLKETYGYGEKDK